MATSTSSSSTQTPAIRGFQFDDSAQLNPTSSVNLFRGRV